MVFIKSDIFILFRSLEQDPFNFIARPIFCMYDASFGVAALSAKIKIFVAIGLGLYKICHRLSLRMFTLFVQTCKQFTSFFDFVFGGLESHETKFFRSAIVEDQI